LEIKQTMVSIIEKNSESKKNMSNSNLKVQTFMFAIGLVID
jgi:hypothetical protein